MFLCYGARDFIPSVMVPTCFHSLCYGAHVFIPYGFTHVSIPCVVVHIAYIAESIAFGGIENISQTR